MTTRTRPTGSEVACSFEVQGPVNEASRRLLRSSHVFSSAVQDALEQPPLREAGRATLTPAQFRLLRLIALNGSPKVGELAHILGVSAAAVSKTLDVLEARRLVQRRRCRSDRRATVLAISTSGQRLVEDHESGKARRVAPLVEALGEAAADHLCALLDELSHGLLCQDGQRSGVCLRCAGYSVPDCPLEALHSACSVDQLAAYTRKEEKT